MEKLFEEVCHWKVFLRLTYQSCLHCGNLATWQPITKFNEDLLRMLTAIMFLICHEYSIALINKLRILGRRS